jgi:hypothetical protein
MRGRAALSWLLAGLAALFSSAALLTAYVDDAIFDSDEFAERASAALENESVRAEVARRVTDDLVLESNADLVGFRSLIEEAVADLIGGRAFESLFRAAVADVHSALFRRDQNSATLTLADIGIVARGALQATSPESVRGIGGGADAEILRIDPPAWTADVAQAAETIQLLGLILFLSALGLAAGCVMAGDRRRGALRLGVAIALAGVIAAVAVGVLRDELLADITDPEQREAAAGVWDAFFGDLRSSFFALAAAGAVIAAAASSLLGPGEVDVPLRQAWAVVMRVPKTPRGRLARGLALIAAGILIVARHEAAVEVAVVLAGLLVVWAGTAELLRLLMLAEGDEREEERRAGGRALAATGVAVIVILAGAALFAAGGGTDEEPLEVRTTGCNGSEELCGRRLDEITFAGTHNAMSAVTNPDYLFGQQDAAFPEQLRDGIRAFQIDAYHGNETEGGQVKTDFSALSKAEKKEATESLGPETLDAALRLRDRIVNSDVTGPRRVYLCHGFCELGAVPMVDAMRQMRDFLAANPSEVILIVVEDHVDPASLVEVAEESGLAELAYDGEVEPLPTLREMIASGGRALITAENDSGDIAPWYLPAYEALFQETPFRFESARELTDPALLDRSCAPNRGPADAPLFLINHWVDTSPAPRPSNAERVNSREALMRRVRTCERLRGLDANVIAVDFYRRGALFEVVDELNESR